MHLLHERPYTHLPRDPAVLGYPYQDRCAQGSDLPLRVAFATSDWASFLMYRMSKGR